MRLARAFSSRHAHRLRTRLRKAIKWGCFALLLVTLYVWIIGHDWVWVGNIPTWIELVDRPGLRWLSSELSKPTLLMDYPSNWPAGMILRAEPTDFTFFNSTLHTKRSILGVNSFPLWCVAIVLTVLSVTSWWLDVLATRRSRAAMQGLCLHCGYSRAGLANAESTPCPECGAAPVSCG